MMYSTLRSNLSLISKANFQQSVKHAHHACKVLIIGGGTGGCTMAAKLSKKFQNAPDHVIVIEPQDIHYYQPLFTLVGGGIKSLKSSKKHMKDVLPQKAQWLKDSVTKFKPDENIVMTSNGDTVEYQQMIVAMGLELFWEQIPGLVDGLKNPKAQVCSIYGSDTVSGVFEKIKLTKEGTAIFTFPNSCVKCPGAPQKIAYLSEDYWRRKKLRDNINIVYNTSLPVLFGVKKYADALWEVCNSRNIKVNCRTNLIEIRSDEREAVFQNLDKPEIKHTIEYSFLHVTPPMGPPKVLQQHKIITNEAGFLDVNPKTLQHNKYNNIYGIGDCTSTPNSKTMAAIASQSKVLYKNLMDNCAGKEIKMAYNGYASCPLVTAPGKCILAEFDYNLQPCETFPVNQGKEMYFTYFLKKHFFPLLYWNFMLKGNWSGPEMLRKIFSIIKKKDAEVVKN
ncbi:sulfide:quinone oxidoreductase, mitochondrial [Copidosoma floridanum]|uniref:sulfide:quinone oxidoreductase, mitochondrial n=1 Tax=Copidosoma floridanum TaxID=29053 RepID=UPI0006C96ECC|nr:sulfide:quinone oxidoreductase, mitochondrial [Copidosoma floridanum]XP_014214930.1 sulfide:quinone oxidoreductase, mitochondrial [Copidosoma floridanum]